MTNHRVQDMVARSVPCPRTHLSILMLVVNLRSSFKEVRGASKCCHVPSLFHSSDKNSLFASGPLCYGRYIAALFISVWSSFFCHSSLPRSRVMCINDQKTSGGELLRTSERVRAFSMFNKLHCIHIPVWSPPLRVKERRGRQAICTSQDAAAIQ